MVVKIAAKLLKIREVLPVKVRDLHFPQEMMMLTSTYQKLNSLRQKKKSMKDAILISTNSNRSGNQKSEGSGTQDGEDEAEEQEQ